jgi:integrase
LSVLVTTYLTKHAGFWKLQRRVPTEVSTLDERGIVRISTGIRIADDPHAKRATTIAGRLNSDLEAYWGGLVAGSATEARRRYEQARSRARAMGFEYVAARDLAERDLDEIVARFERLIDRKLLVDQPQTVSAVLGGEEPASIKLSELFGVYSAITAAERGDFSPDQERKWKNPKLRAVSNLIAVIGDKEITNLSRDDALDFRKWWSERVIDDGVAIDTANKDFGHVNRMLRTVERQHRIGLKPVFSELRLEGRETETRAAFTPAWVQTRILAPGALAGLNAEARGVVLLMAETGLRISEAVNLLPNRIVLEAEVPHVQVRPDGRRLKTKESNRDMPLVGVALVAMRERPQGFPGYRDKGATLSATVNKFMEENGLRPSQDHSLYSLRHTFEDRLTAIDVPDKLIARLMGHKHQRPKYGAGPSLAQLREWMQRIAFKVT